MAQDILSLLNDLEPSVRRAFLAAINDIKSEAQMGVIIGALQQGNVENVINALNLDASFFQPLDDALRAAYLQGGVNALAALPVIPDPFSGGRVVARFDGRNLRAEAFLKRQSSELITDIVTETRKAARSVLELSMQADRGPRATALDLVGRVNRATGRREGGLIGHLESVTDPENGTLARAMRELRSGNKTQMTKFLSRTGVTGREKLLVQRYISQGKPVPADVARKLVGRYSDNLLKLRGETIARTELLQSLHHAQDEGLMQLIDGGKLRPEQITRTWDAANDGDTRPSHSAMDGQIRGQGVAFISGDGYRLLHPGDRSQGAPAKEIVNCRCRVSVSIDSLQELAG